MNAAWEKMNSGLPVKTPKVLANKPSTLGNKPAQKKTPVNVLSQMNFSVFWVFCLEDFDLFLKLRYSCYLGLDDESWPCAKES